jgi:hypothetical protein
MSKGRQHSCRSERSGAQDLSGPAGFYDADHCGWEPKLRAMTWMTEASALTFGDLRSAEGKPPTDGLSVAALMISLLTYSSMIDTQVDRIIEALCDVLT